MKARHVAAIGRPVGAAAHAHHNFRAEFDINAPFTVTGTVTRVEWTNPHTWFYLDVKDDKSAVVNWAMEMGSPNALMRAGWKRTSMNAGDEVTVEGYRSGSGKRPATRARSRSSRQVNGFSPRQARESDARLCYGVRRDLRAPLGAQWLGYPAKNIPRTADGKPNLSAPAPRTADSKPDLSGIWQPTPTQTTWPAESKASSVRNT